MTKADDSLLVWIEGSLGRIRLNRPHALNALTESMALNIAKVLEDWRHDDAITAILIDASGDKAFCAGGDILDLYTRGKNGEVKFGQDFWRQEYRLNAAIAAYPKPYIALMDGITMGGGVGISAHGSHRIVTERTILAMPETGIGFLPDVGATWILSRAPEEAGLYLGLTGARMTADDAIFAGFADHFIESKTLPEFIAALVEGDDIDETCRRFGAKPPSGKLSENRKDIADVFGQTTVHACAERLTQMSKANNAWAEKTLKALNRNSPLSVASAFYAINEAKTLPTLEDCLALEYRFSFRTLTNPDFFEGVRAAIVDKDKNPKWHPEHLDDVTPELVQQMMGPLGADEWTPAQTHVEN